jgi:hypothetical protein
MRKLTPWFDVDTKPVRIGAYQTKFPRFKNSTDDWIKGYSYWNGKGWSNQWSRVVDVNAHKKWTSGAIQEKMWRGLAEEPK